MKFQILTLFPAMFQGPLTESILRRGVESGAISVDLHNIRDFALDRHRTVDDAPYGGGAGMVMKPEPFFEAVDTLQAQPPIVLMSARGRPFTHQDAVRFAASAELTLLCGHYKDVDQRVADGLAAELGRLEPGTDWRVHVAYEFRDPLLRDVLDSLPAGEPVELVPMYAVESAFTHEISRSAVARSPSSDGFRASQTLSGVATD